MPIFIEDEIAFIHIPKCAGTSIEVSFGWADRYPKIGLEPTRTELDYKHLYGGGLQHLTAKEIKNIYLREHYNRFFTFSVIRDPIDRLFSHYVWRNYRFQKIGRPLDELRAEFSKFVNYVYEKYARHQIFLFPKRGYVYDVQAGPSEFSPNDIERHLIPQCAFLFDEGELIVDNIFSFERLPELYQELHKRVPRFRGIERRMASELGLTSQELYTDELIEKVRELYRDDFSLYSEIAGADGVLFKSQ